MPVQPPAWNPASRMRPIFSLVARATTVLVACATLTGCESAPSGGGGTHREALEFSDRLAPGDYRGAVTNASHGLSLDTLDCELDTASVTVRLPDGDSVLFDVRTMAESEDEIWEIRGTEGRTGDEWVIRIRK